MSKARQGTRKRVAPQKFDFLWRLMADTDLSASAKFVAATLLLKFHNTKPAGAIQALPPSPRPSDAVAVRFSMPLPSLRTPDGSPSKARREDRRAIQTNSVSTSDGCRPRHPHRCTACTSPVTCTANGTEGCRFTAHEPLRTTHPSGGGWGEEISPRRAPDGAAAEFEELRQLWQRPYGINGPRRWRRSNASGDGDVRSGDHPRQCTALGGGERAAIPAQLEPGWPMAHG